MSDPTAGDIARQLQDAIDQLTASRLIGTRSMRAMRERHGITMRQLAAEADVSVVYLSEVEHGTKSPQPYLFSALDRLVRRKSGGGDA